MNLQRATLHSKKGDVSISVVLIETKNVYPWRRTLD